MFIIFGFRKTKTVFSNIILHVIFCTRYRRKLFADTDLSKRVAFLISEKCSELNIEIKKLEIFDSYVEMIIECPPDLSPNQVVYRIKAHCNNNTLKDDFEVIKKIPNLWTRSCLISTDMLDEKTIQAYVLSQKSRC